MVSLVGRIAVTGPNGQPPSNADELIEKHVDEVLDELLRLNAVDPAIDLDLTQNEVVISVLVEEPDPLFATITASGLIRSAIHLAGSGPLDDFVVALVVDETSSRVIIPVIVRKQIDGIAQKPYPRPMRGRYKKNPFAALSRLD